MKKKNIFLIYPFLIMGFTLNSCKHDDLIQPLISKYNIVYMDYPTGIGPSLENDGNVILEYRGTRISKRKGGIIQVNPATGYDYKFLKDIYDTIIYSHNKGLIKNLLIYQGETYYGLEKTIIFDEEGRIFQKIQKDRYYRTDTINYYYSSNGLLIKIENKKPYKVETSNFYYSSKNNIDSIISTHYTYDIRESKTIEYFNNFDEATNTLRHLMLFDETFNRSLSRNNYLYYKKIKYDSNNILIEKCERTYTIYYNDQGCPIFY